MLTIYSYTYDSAIKKYADSGFILTKIGDTTRLADIRMAEQGGAAEYEHKIKIGEWPDVKVIKRDFDLHAVLIKRGLHHQDGSGTEWFKIPGQTIQEAHSYIDELIESFEGVRVRKAVTLRQTQEHNINRAMDIIADTPGPVSILANFAPRFGKTIWALSLFNRMTERYGNRIMLLPAYWLSVHTSFIDEIDRYKDFQDIIQIDPLNPDAPALVGQSLRSGKRVIIPISLHGDVDEWKAKHQWIATIPNDELFVFADEGDFGTHTDPQVDKMNHLFTDNPGSLYGSKFVTVYASGTNVQRLAKCSKHIDGVLYSAYSQLETTEPNMIKRRFYCTHTQALKAQVEQLNEEVQPSWTKIWDKPLANKAFIGQLFVSLTGGDTLRRELNLSAIADTPIDCFMLLVSADKAQMTQIKQIAERAIPEWEIQVLNGDYTSNRDAEEETITLMNRARIAGKQGMIIIANQMGSRSYSISQIQSTVIAFDRGSVDATMQKVSRCLTPGQTYSGNPKTHGFIIDLSFDPNRAENIERIILEEAIQVQRDMDSDFTTAVRFVLSAINLFKMNEYGLPVAVTEDQMFRVFGDNETMLKVADISVDPQAAIESGVFDILQNVRVGGKQTDKKMIIGDAKNFVGTQTRSKRTQSDPAVRQMERIINEAIRSLNMSATSVYYLADGGESYRECINNIQADDRFASEFADLFGITPADTIQLLDNRALNESILDVIVQNSKPKPDQYLF